jgi:L-alanine-DL-glutamate epimerase-like enolase superfamily enzyme
MKISQIQVFQLPIPLKEPFIISLGPLTHANNLIVKITTENGLIGFGENSPFQTINGENMDTGFVVARSLVAAIIGKDATNISGLIQKMDATIFGNNSIKSAFDMALYDLNAQYAGLPLYQFLGGKNKVLQTDYTISLNALPKMVEDALKIKNAGFEIIKVKLGGNPREDIERVKAIRAAIGSRIAIRIYANQGWQVQDVLGILNEIKACKIQHCEEPINRQLFMDLPQLSAQSPIPLMADESCCDSYDAERLLKLNAVPRWNIKLGKSGGIFKALQMLKLAEANNIQVQLGGFLESRLGFTAAAHLALCSDSVQHIDFDTPLMFSQDLVEYGITYGPNGTINVPNLIGLGASISDEILKDTIQSNLKLS